MHQLFHSSDALLSKSREQLRHEKLSCWWTSSLRASVSHSRYCILCRDMTVGGEYRWCLWSIEVFDGWFSSMIYWSGTMLGSICFVKSRQRRMHQVGTIKVSRSTCCVLFVLSKWVLVKSLLNSTSRCLFHWCTFTELCQRKCWFYASRPEIRLGW
jgi:hypothetical protein